MFDEAERLVKDFHSNKTGTFYEYDQDGRVTQLRIEKAGETIDKFRYEYDSNGNITKIWSDMDGAWVEYTYDSLGQLLLEKYSDGTTIEYQYDELGNRTLMNKDGVNTIYSYNAEKSRLVSVGSNNYTYDDNGNVLTDGAYTYVRGDDNKLKEVKQGTTTIAAFTYDALGRRETMTDANGVMKTFHYDGDDVTYVNQSDGKIYRFAYDHSGRPIFMSYQNNQYWYHYDNHGNVIRMTDVNGETIATYRYDAWGNITSQWGTSGTGSEIVNLNPYRYAKYWYDSDIDKYYLKARYYDAKIGRFLAKDSLAIRVGESLSLNAYTYGDNNPVKYGDPSGLYRVEMDGGGGYHYTVDDKSIGGGKEGCKLEYGKFDYDCSYISDQIGPLYVDVLHVDTSKFHVHGSVFEAGLNNYDDTNISMVVGEIYAGDSIKDSSLVLGGEATLVKYKIEAPIVSFFGIIDIYSSVEAALGAVGAKVSLGKRNGLFISDGYGGGAYFYVKEGKYMPAIKNKIKLWR